jgi:hypothetical protein
MIGVSVNEYALELGRKEKTRMLIRTKKFIEI